MRLAKLYDGFLYKTVQILVDSISPIGKMRAWYFIEFSINVFADKSDIQCFCLHFAIVYQSTVIIKFGIHDFGHVRIQEDRRGVFLVHYRIGIYCENALIMFVYYNL